LLPKKYEIAGTDPDSKIFFRGVRVLDSTGRLPYLANVLVLGERIAAIGNNVQPPAGAKIIDGRGRTLMSGLGDAHTHFSWNNTG
jgi:imidazolonepropionase-like amidohydrolase